MNIVCGSVEYIHIYRLTGFVFIQRIITERHYVSGSTLLFMVRKPQPLVIVFRMIISDIPHLQEHKGKTPCSRSFEHDCSILPVSESLPAVDVFVREIDASVECGPAVYYKDLTVITVIIV